MAARRTALVGAGADSLSAGPGSWSLAGRRAGGAAGVVVTGRCLAGGMVTCFVYKIEGLRRFLGWE